MTSSSQASIYMYMSLQPIQTVSFNSKHKLTDKATGEIYYFKSGFVSINRSGRIHLKFLEST